MFRLGRLAVRQVSCILPSPAGLPSPAFYPAYESAFRACFKTRAIQLFALLAAGTKIN